jgi:hypothetical protein
MNFSTWGSTSAHDLAEATEELPETIAEGEMPLQDYTWLHPEARLNAAEKRTLIDWFNQGVNSSEKSISKRKNDSEEEHDED